MSYDRYTRLRNDLSVPESALSDEAIDDLYERAEEIYSDSRQIEAQVRILTINQLLASSAKRTDYAQNLSQEKSSQVFGHLERLRKIYQQELADATAVEIPAIQWGKLRKKPPYIEENPDD